MIIEEVFSLIYFCSLFVWNQEGCQLHKAFFFFTHCRPRTFSPSLVHEYVTDHSFDSSIEFILSPAIKWTEMWILLAFNDDKLIEF